MTIIDDYLEYQETYTSKYGKNTCVLMQIGHFFEAYGVDNETEKLNAPNIYNLADIMNIQMTRKNKSVIGNSRSNPLMIGVNIYSIDKYIQLLLNRGFTIVLIEQVTEPPEPERKVTNIYSPGTSINHLNKSDSNKCVCIYIETINKISSNKKQINIGLSSIDLSTGHCEIYETYSKIDDEKYSYDEVFRYIQNWNPKELVVIRNNCDETEAEISAYLELNNRIVHFKKYESHYNNISYQTTFFEKIYRGDHGMLTIHEYLDIEKMPYATLCFIYLLEFSYNHNENILHRIEKPTIISNLESLILTNNTINQLNIVSNNYQDSGAQIYDSLISVIDKTKTSVGKRYLREMLLNPITNIKELNRRYDIIESLTDKDLCATIQQLLAPIVDIQRLHRKISLKLIQPADFIGLLTSYENILKLFELCNGNIKLKHLIPNQATLDIFSKFISDIQATLDFEVIGKYHLDKITSSFFKKGIYKSIDATQQEIAYDYECMTSMSVKLSKLVDDTNTRTVKLDRTDRDGHYLSITSKRLISLKKRLGNMKHIPIKINEKVSLKHEHLEFKAINKTQHRITCKQLLNWSQRVRENEYEIGNVVKETFFDYLNHLDTNYIQHLKSIAIFIGNIDTYSSVANTARIYGYTKPIIDYNEPNSFCEFKQIRHPIIERLQGNNYVTNDICLGKNDGKSDGMLLYGTNASGKSSMMKAVGCNIILAQAGFFVACGELTFSPYQYLFSRINNNDNLFKGESSFAVEMSELRNILKRCNKHSLVLGDELCSGTESISALSIFAASVRKLSKLRANFIFATHLHELSKMECVNTLSNIAIFHLKVIYDENLGKLIYDRKLTQGSGNSIYGLEVCKSMDMDREFLEDANRIRQEIMGVKETILEYKPSKYNSKLIVDICEICGNDADDTHHIKFQCSADSNNIIEGHIQKDTKGNLVPLCKPCHENVHKNLIIIEGYKDTSSGKVLDYEHVETKNKKTNKKYSEIQLEVIREFLEKNSKVNNKTMCLLLENKHQIKISSTTLGKIKKGTY